MPKTPALSLHLTLPSLPKIPSSSLLPRPGPALLYLARLSPGSRRAMRSALDQVAKLLTAGGRDALSLPWHLLRYVHTQAVRSYLKDRYSASYTNKLVSALRGVLRESWRMGLMSREDFERAADLERVRSDVLPSGRALSEGEIEALLCACENRPGAKGERDFALVALLYAAGLRRGELVQLDLEDYDPERGELHVRFGKGQKARLLYARGFVGDALTLWLKRRGDRAGPLFLPVRKGGALLWKRLVEQSVSDILKARAREAGVRDFSPHDLRRTCATDLIDAGADLGTVQRILGHSHVQTTLRYDRRSEGTKKDALLRLVLPFSERGQSRDEGFVVTGA